ncbi:hypothetical protein DX928_23590 [Bacillus swezeyi]|uniref:Uncharacterized protein n=1 Tax=Bacillus swezeyi TaxID=1925020 RepID=A0A5M8RJG0_9BACI|nr:hypothetical protein DX927_23350 [Bacillus swezeyi]KAA6471552.1 hypothetical protein DX928_23590 [Bacillus swezeyi]
MTSILHGRKKYEVIKTSTNFDETIILYKVPNSKLHGLLKVDKSEFFKVKSSVGAYKIKKSINPWNRAD